MSLNLLDIFVLGYTAFGIRKGYRRGLEQELSRLIGVSLFVLTGWGLSHWIRSTLGEIQHLTGQTMGGAGFVAALVGSYYLAKALRDHIVRWVKLHVPDEKHRQQTGAAAGGLRTLMIGCALVVFVGLLPLGIIKEPFANGSFFGRNLIRFVVPVYEKISGH